MNRNIRFLRIFANQHTGYVEKFGADLDLTA